MISFLRRRGPSPVDAVHISVGRITKEGQPTHHCSQIHLFEWRPKLCVVSDFCPTGEYREGITLEKTKADVAAGPYTVSPFLLNLTRCGETYLARYAMPTTMEISNYCSTGNTRWEVPG
jgi:hypothetical protein